MDIKDTHIGGLWSTHYPKRRTDSRSLMYCVSIAHAVRNVAQNNTSDGIAGRLRDALICLDVPEDEFTYSLRKLNVTSFRRAGE